MLLKNMIVVKTEKQGIAFQDPFFKQRDFKGIIPIVGWLSFVFEKLPEINKPYDIIEVLEKAKTEYTDKFTLYQIQRVIDYCNLI